MDMSTLKTALGEVLLEKEVKDQLLSTFSKQVGELAGKIHDFESRFDRYELKIREIPEL